MLAVKSPKWNPTYTLKGVLYVPDAGIEEPFEAWFDKNTGRSRIDYYNGTTKTYQLSSNGKYGALFKFAPVTTDDEPNKMTCFQIKGTKQHKVNPQPILPDCKKFKLAGNIFYFILIFSDFK